MMKFNNAFCLYALNNDYYVEYFIWVFLKTKGLSGAHDVSDLDGLNICKSTLKRKLKDNPFFSVSKGKIYLRSTSKLPVKKGKFYFNCEINELNKFARKNSTTSSRIIKGWNDTLIKYLMICILSCKYGEKKPYALQLISQDIKCSISTIQRALKNLFVERIVKQQEKDSPRSFMYQKSWVNLSPNYNKILIGKMFQVD